METITKQAHKPNSFKEGDWCFCEFQLMEILKVENGIIKSVTNGYATTSGDFTDRCYEISVEIKRISDYVKKWSDKFHDIGLVSLNYPDLKHALITKWMEMCNARYDKEALYILEQKFFDFCTKVENAIEGIKKIHVDGLKLIR